MSYKQLNSTERKHCWLLSILVIMGNENTCWPIILADLFLTSESILWPSPQTSCQGRVPVIPSPSRIPRDRWSQEQWEWLMSRPHKWFIFILGLREGDRFVQFMKGILEAFWNQWKWNFQIGNQMPSVWLTHCAGELGSQVRSSEMTCKYLVESESQCARTDQGI